MGCSQSLEAATPDVPSSQSTPTKTTMATKTNDNQSETSLVNGKQMNGNGSGTLLCTTLITLGGSKQSLID